MTERLKGGNEAGNCVYLAGSVVRHIDVVNEAAIAADVDSTDSPWFTAACASTASEEEDEVVSAATGVTLVAVGRAARAVVAEDLEKAELVALLDVLCSDDVDAASLSVVSSALARGNDIVESCS